MVSFVTTIDSRWIGGPLRLDVTFPVHGEDVLGKKDLTTAIPWFEGLSKNRSAVWRIPKIPEIRDRRPGWRAPLLPEDGRMANQERAGGHTSRSGVVSLVSDYASHQFHTAYSRL